MPLKTAQDDKEDKQEMTTGPANMNGYFCYIKGMSHQACQVTDHKLQFLIHLKDLT